MDGWTDGGWMDGWMDGRRGGRADNVLLRLFNFSNL